MKVTDVRIHLHDGPNTQIQAFAELVLDAELVLRNFAIFEDPTLGGALRVEFPNRVLNSGRIQDTAYCITRELHNEIVFAILDEYRRFIRGE